LIDAQPSIYSNEILMENFCFEGILMEEFFF